jgi:hypothetical protein
MLADFQQFRCGEKRHVRKDNAQGIRETTLLHNHRHAARAFPLNAAGEPVGPAPTITTS